MVRRASANSPLHRAAGGEEALGMQLCDIQRRADLSFLSSPHHEHLHQLQIVPLNLSHTRLRCLGPRKLREQSKKSSNAREEKIESFSFSLPITPPAFLSSKSKGSFHQEPPKTSFQFSELEECQFTGQLIFYPPEKFSSCQVTREKNRQFRSSLTRPPDCAGLV